MVNLRRDSKDNFIARKRLPDDVREDYGRQYGARHEAKFFARASLGRQEAQRRFHAWETETENRIATIRAQQRGDGIDLEPRDAVALAGEWYQWFVARYEKKPGDPVAYDEALWDMIEAMRDFAPEEIRAEPLRDTEWTRDPEVRSGVLPIVADRGHTAQFLADRGVVLSNAARVLFLDCVLDNYIPALLRLERLANRDYSPDELPKSFPPFQPREAEADTGITPLQLFEAWKKARQPKQSTVESWRTVFRKLVSDFPSRAASAITEGEAQQWLDGLVTEKRLAFTVRNTWLRATTTVYTWGKRRKLIRINPFASAVVEVPRRKHHRPKSLYEHERTAILRAASAIKDTTTPDLAARRWVPWLQAYTGARPGEITQLRRVDVARVDDVWALNLTPEAGSIKSDEARRVPIHPHLIEQGFLDFVKRSGDGPLFYRPRRNKRANAAPLTQRKSPAAQARQRLAAWIRKDIGITDEHLSPNHAWRHTFKLIGRRVAEDTLLDYICGHAPATEGRGYGAPELKDLARVINKFPRYDLSSDKERSSDQD